MTTVTSRALLNRTAIVTGSSKGIGAGIALAFAEAGARVCVNYASDAEKAAEIVNTIQRAGGTATAIRCNIGSPAEVEDMMTQVTNTFGPIDILVNNASVFSFAPLDDLSVDDLRSMVDINVIGTILCCREAVQRFAPSGGSIINIGSMSGQRFNPGAVAYSATKASISAITGVLALELAPRGIRVNQINPGAVNTEGAQAIGAMTAEAQARYVNQTPLGRVGQPRDIAGAAMFLASDEAAWITGETICVTGGLR